MQKRTRYVISVVVALMSISLSANEPVKPHKNDACESIEKPDKWLPSSSRSKNHVLFVNLNHAMDDASFAEAAAYLSMKYVVNVATTQVDHVSLVSEVLKDQGALTKRFGEKAVLVVAICKEPKTPSYWSIPGHFAQVNLRGLDKDNPSPTYLRKRRVQMVMRGLAHACGIGANADEFCVMYMKSFTLEGMDLTSATFGPFAYYPLREILTAMGGEEIFSPPYLQE